tara:strand:- start:4485 stop:5438 length:954 start_codon:yes stop_codon:yes gene_type:complete
MLNIHSTLFFTGLLFLMTSCATNTPLQDQENKQQSAQTFRISDGIEVALIPPRNFVITQEHYGFIQPETFSRIRVSEKEFTYSNYLAQLSKENLLKNQLQLIKKEQVNLKGAVCTLFTLRQNIAGVYFEKLWLVSGDNLSSVQVEASYPESASYQLKSAIKTSLLSLSVATNQNLRLYTGLPFTFSQTPNFKLKKRYANSIVLLPLDSVDTKESVVISTGKINQEVESLKMLSDHFLKKGKHHKKVEILNSKMIKIDKIPALAATAYVELNQTPTFVYQILSYQQGKFLLLQAQTPKQNKKHFKASVDKLMEHFVFK